MEDDRFAQRAPQEQVPAQVDQLRLARREAAVVVEARFADGHDAPRIVGQLLRSPARSVVVGAAATCGWMPAAASPVARARQRDRRARRFEVPAGNQDALDAGQASRRRAPPAHRRRRAGGPAGGRASRSAARVARGQLGQALEQPDLVALAVVDHRVPALAGDFRLAGDDWPPSSGTRASTSSIESTSRRRRAAARRSTGRARRSRRRSRPCRC
jgi:hypothetical protein